MELYDFNILLSISANNTKVIASKGNVLFMKGSVWRIEEAKKVIDAHVEESHPQTPHETEEQMMKRKRYSERLERKIVGRLEIKNYSNLF